MKIVTKKVMSIPFEFEDGVIKECRFDNKAFSILDEEYEEGSIRIISKSFLKPRITVEKLIYAGLKSCDDNITKDEAKNIAYNLELEDINEILKNAVENYRGKKSLTAEDMKNITPDQIALMQKLIQE